MDVWVWQFFFCTHPWHSFPAAWRMLEGGADDVLKSNKMKERNDISVMTKAEWGQRAWPILVYPTHPSQTQREERRVGGCKRGIIDTRARKGGWHLLKTKWERKTLNELLKTLDTFLAWRTESVDSNCSGNILVTKSVKLSHTHIILHGRRVKQGCNLVTSKIRENLKTKENCKVQWSV